MPNQHPNPHLQWRRTKIVATLGPASAESDQISRLLKAGVNVVRLNMSHGSHEAHRALFERVRSCAQALDLHVAILMDLCGPKIRVGRFRDGAIELKARQKVTVTTRKLQGEEGLIPSQYPKLHEEVEPGHRILLDDGKLELAVESIDGPELHCRVIYGGTLKDHKGMNLPDSTLSVPAFTKKDREDARLAAELGADLIALSFVRRSEDIAELQRFLKRLKHPIPIIAKIEKPEALADIDAILEQAYGIMIARGDLGIELPAERVPIIQNELIQKARIAHRPVIVATQMLESMIENARPTRAEVGDVANAAASSADAVMLSGETASGRYPLKAVQAMDRTLREMEYFQWQQGRFGEPLSACLASRDQGLRHAVARAVNTLARELKLQGIIIPTNSGTTAQIIAADRPTAPCMGVSSSTRICRRLALHWGIVPVLTDTTDIEDWSKLSAGIARRYKLTRTGKTVLLVSGFSNDPAQCEPAMKLLQL